MNYVYLVRAKNKSKFKIGFTTNPRARAKQYQTHSLDVEYIAHIEVSNKKYEKLCHYELHKNNFQKCITQGSTEWFQGTINYTDFYDIVETIKERIKKYNDR